LKVMLAEMVILAVLLLVVVVALVQLELLRL
jgi:hypothetical protein